MARPGPRPDSPGADRGRSAEVRAALVDAAIDALRETGYAGTSAREIAGRAGCSQALVFYHFGSVNDLLLAALDEVSARRMEAYRVLLDEARSATAAAQAAKTIFTRDLEAGYVRVLIEMITAAHSVPGLGEEVARRLAPWRDVAQDAVRRALGRSPAARMLPPAESAHAVLAAFLGMELLASLDGATDAADAADADDGGDPAGPNRAAAFAVFDRMRVLARLLDAASVLRLPGAGRAGQ